MTEQHDEAQHDEAQHDVDLTGDAHQQTPNEGQGEQHGEAPDERQVGAGLGDHATGDIVIDSALQDLRDAPSDDLDAQIDAGQRVHQTLQARLSDLGGE